MTAVIHQGNAATIAEISLRLSRRAKNNTKSRALRHLQWPQVPQQRRAGDQGFYSRAAKMILRGDIASLKEKTLTLPSGFQTNDSAPEWVRLELHQA
jgi:hypothetical protein